MEDFAKCGVVMLWIDFETCVAKFHVGGEENERRDEKLALVRGAHYLSNSGSSFPVRIIQMTWLLLDCISLHDVQYLLYKPYRRF